MHCLVGTKNWSWKIQMCTLQQKYKGKRLWTQCLKLKGQPVAPIAERTRLRAVLQSYRKMKKALRIHSSIALWTHHGCIQHSLARLGQVRRHVAKCSSQPASAFQGCIPGLGPTQTTAQPTPLAPSWTAAQRGQSSWPAGQLGHSEVPRVERLLPLVSFSDEEPGLHQGGAPTTLRCNQRVLALQSYGEPIPLHCDQDVQGAAWRLQ
jgi:hypothetical protein